MNGREWAMLLTLAMLWAGSFFFLKVLVRELPPLTIVFGRVAIAAAALHLLLAARRDPMPRDGALWRRFAAMGVLNNVVPFSLIVFGETRIASGLASILNATTPVFAVLAAHLLTADERMTGGKVAGVGFGLAGVAMLIGPAALRGIGGGDLIGEGACLLAAASYATAGIYGRRFRGVPPLKVATGQLTMSAAMMAPLMLAIDRPWMLSAPSPTGWLALLALALFSTALAFVLYFRILAAAGATNVLLVTLLSPVGAITLGAVVLGEAVTWPAMAGVLLIGLGLAAIDGRAWRRLSGSRSGEPVRRPPASG